MDRNMGAPSAVASRLEIRFNLFVTNVDGLGPCLHLWGQTDKDSTSLLERLLTAADAGLRAGKGALAPGVMLEPGTLCLAQFKDSGFFRARVLSVRDGLLTVLFIDFGNRDCVPPTAVRTLESFPAALLALPPLANEYVLARAAHTAGRWDEATLLRLQQILCYHDHPCTIEAKLQGWTTISILLNSTDLLEHLVLSKICTAVTPVAQLEMLRSAAGLPVRQQEVPIPEDYGKHAAFANRGFPSNPASTMRLQSSAVTFNGYTGGETPSTPNGLATQRVLMNRAAGRNYNQQRALLRQPFEENAARAVVAAANMAAASTSPLATASASTTATSPKKLSTYKTRLLEMNADYKVCVSFARDGPELFAVQLSSDLPSLQAMINELNKRPHRSLAEPPVPGTVCLGRMSSDGTICRTVCTKLVGSHCSLFFVDFGDTELVSYYDIYEIPEQFVKPSVYALLFRLSGLDKLTKGAALTEAFQRLVELKTMTLRVVPAEGPPLVQYAELYLNGRSVTETLQEELSMELQELEPLPAGSESSVLVSYVDSCQKFFIQLSDNIDALDTVMGAVEDHCKVAPPLESVSAGAVCCALFPEDNVWYRARVVEVRGDKALVYYVDYGNDHLMELSNLRSIPGKLLQLPAQAIKCALKGFEDKADTNTSNLLEMLALEKTLTAHVVGVTSEGAMLTSLVHDAITPPLDIAHRITQLTQPRRNSQSRTSGPTTPPASEAAAVVTSPEGSVKSENRFRSDKHFRDDRRPREQEWAPRGGSFRDKDKDKAGFQRSALGRHSEKNPRGDRNERQGGRPWERNQEQGGKQWEKNQEQGGKPWEKNQEQGGKPWEKNQEQGGKPWEKNKEQGGKPWEKNQEQSNPNDEWDETVTSGGGRPGRDRRKAKSEQQDDPGRGGWKGRGEKRPRQGQEGADSAQRNTSHSSIQQRLRRDNFRKAEPFQDDHDHRAKKEWGENRDRGEKDFGERSYNRRDRENFGENRDNDSRAERGDRGERRGWGDKKEGFQKRSYKDNRGESSNFTPRDRADRFDGNRSFGSNRSDTARQLTSPVTLETQFASPEIENGSQHEVAVAWFTSPENFFVQLTAQQAAFTDMMFKIPDLYKGIKPYTGVIEVGNSVLARFPEDRVLYRATVLGVQPMGRYIVQYIDFGNKHIVEAKDIWQLDQELMNLPKMAVHCSLADVKAPGDEWAKGKEMEVHFSAPRCQCIFHGCPDDMYRVSLWNNGVSVAETLAEKGLATLLEQSSATLKDEPIDLSVVVGQEVVCRVTHVHSLGRFHVQLDLDKAALVESTIAALQPTALQPLPAESILDGTHCTVSHEGKVHRAILEEVSDKDHIKAQLPDYGSTVTVSSPDLSILPPELGVYYYQSLVCRFHNYNDNSTPLMTQRELAAKLTGNKFIIYINSVHGTELVSTLYELTGSKVAAFEPDEGAHDSVTPLCARAVFNYSFGPSYLAHAESLSEVYFQRACDNDAVSELLDRLFKFYEEGTPEPLESHEEESLCVAKSIDGNWYRATIVSASKDNCKVQFVDYGNSEDVSKDCIKKLDASFYEPNSLALVVSLGLTPLQDDAVTKLTEMLSDKEVLVTLSIGDEGWLANLHLNGEDLTMKLVNDKIGAPQVIPSEEVNETGAPTGEPAPLPSGTVSVYIAHVDTPGQFWLQMADKVDTIEEIQAELQEKSAAYAELENKEMGTLCVAKYSVDEMWYRAEVLDSDADITTVRFIDYGNTDVLDNVPGVLKVIPDKFKEVERFAVKSSVNAVPTGTGQWSEPASDYFTEVVGDMSTPLDALIVLKDITTYVDLFVNGQNLTDKLVSEGHATRSDQTECGDLASCFASHVNSPSEFWIQLENSAPELQAVEAAMADSENFPELTDKEEGTICAAKYPEDGFWYRAQIIVEGSEGIEVLFMDYGNASIATELRSLPEDLKAKPALSRKCALQKSRDIKSWSRKSEIKFNEMAAEGATIFNVQFIASGDISIVELYLENKSVTEELAALCNAPPSIERPTPLGQALLSSGSVCHANSPTDFYVKLQESIDKLNNITEKLKSAENFDEATDVKVGSLVAALWADDEQWYRARVIEFCDVGSHVQFLDYGNKAKCERFRQLPDELVEEEPIAKHCSLTGVPAHDDKYTDAFLMMLDVDDSADIQIEFLDTTKEPRLVRLLINGEDACNLIKEINSQSHGETEPVKEAEIVEQAARESATIVESAANTDEKTDEVDLETSRLDESLDGNVTVIENKSFEKTVEKEPTGQEYDRTNELDKSQPTDSEEFATPQTSPKKQSPCRSPEKKVNLDDSTASVESKTSTGDVVDETVETEKISSFPEQMDKLAEIESIPKQNDELAEVEIIPNQNDELAEVESVPECKDKLSEVQSIPEKKKVVSVPEQKDELAEVESIPEQMDEVAEVEIIPEQKNKFSEVESIPEQMEELAEVESIREQMDKVTEVEIIPEQKDKLSEVKSIPEQKEELAEVKHEVDITEMEHTAEDSDSKTTEPAKNKCSTRTNIMEEEPKTNPNKPMEVTDIDNIQENKEHNDDIRPAEHEAEVKGESKPSAEASKETSEKNNK